MAVRVFDGTDDHVVLSIGNIVNNGAITMLVLCKRTTGTGWRTPIDISSGTTQRTGMQASPGNEIHYISGSSFDTTGVAWGTTEGWVIVAISKASGTAATRGHKYVFSTDTWARSNGSSIGNSTQGDTVRLGEMASFGEFFAGRIAAAAVWSRAMSDAEMDGLVADIQSWMDATPNALWLLTQAATSTAVTDETAGGADQTAITGTTVVTDDDPPGFDLTLGGALEITPAPVTVNATAGTVTVIPNQEIAPAAVTVDVTPGSLALTVVQSVTPDPVTVTTTAGALTITPGSVGVTPDPVTVTATPGTVTVTAGASFITPEPVTVTAAPGSMVTTTGPVDVVPAAVTVDVTPGSVTLTVGALFVTPEPVTVTATAGTLTVTTGSVAITPDPVTVSVTPGALSAGIGVTLTAPTVNVTPGSVDTTVGAAPITPAPVEVTITPGTVTLVVPIGGMPGLIHGKPLMPGAVETTVKSILGGTGGVTIAGAVEVTVKSILGGIT